MQEADMKSGTGTGGGKQRVRKKRWLSCSITLSYVEWKQSVNERYRHGIDEITAPFTANRQKAGVIFQILSTDLLGISHQCKHEANLNCPCLLSDIKYAAFCEQLYNN